MVTGGFGEKQNSGSSCGCFWKRRMLCVCGDHAGVPRKRARSGNTIDRQPPGVTLWACQGFQVQAAVLSAAPGND